MSKTIRLKDITVLVSPTLELWGYSPEYDNGIGYFNGRLLAEFAYSDLSTPKSNVGTMSSIVNRLIQKNGTNKFKIIDKLRSDGYHDYDKHELTAVAYTIWRVEPEYYKNSERFIYLDPNSRLEDYKPAEKDVIESNLKGSQFVKPMGLQYWLGTKEELYGKTYEIEIDIDGKDPGFKYKTYSVPEFDFHMKYDTNDGQFKINGIRQGKRIFESIPEGFRQFMGPTIDVNDSEWAMFFHAGKNIISFDKKPFAKINVVNRSPNDKVDSTLTIRPPEIEGFGIDEYRPVYVSHNFTKNPNADIEVNIEKFPKRCWEDAETYIEDKHRKVIEEQLTELTDAIYQKDQKKLNLLMAPYLKEVETVYPNANKETFAHSDIKSYIANIVKNHKSYKVESIVSSDVKINTYFNDKLIQVSSKDYDSLYYGYEENKEGQKDYFRLESLPTFLVIKNGKAQFCM